jgi:hypothetical protein
MSLGWALRGFIGGGPLGAMIPGAMIGLALCRLLRRESDAALVAAFAAVGIGFGGEETYGQTVGLSFLPETYWWALLGFAIKGAAWGLLGGAMIGIAFTRVRYRTPDLVAGFGLLVAGTWAGWKLVNQPKLIYFSNRLDRPRAEVWAGLILGGILLLLWLTRRGGGRMPARFALWGALGGGVGFSAGAAIQVWGRPILPVFPLGWWKVMELTFGAVLGLAFGWCAWRNRDELAAVKQTAPAALKLPCAVYMAVTAIGIRLWLEPALHTRFNYVIVGAILLSLALRSRTLCWQIAITLTVWAFAYDLLKGKPALPQWPLWTFVIAITLATVLMTARAPRTVPMFLWITWTAVAVSLLKSFVPLVSTEPVMMESLFVILAACVSWWCVLHLSRTGPGV